MEGMKMRPTASSTEKVYILVLVMSDLNGVVDIVLGSIHRETR